MKAILIGGPRSGEVIETNCDNIQAPRMTTSPLLDVISDPFAPIEFTMITYRNTGKKNKNGYYIFMIL